MSVPVLVASQERWIRQGLVSLLSSEPEIKIVSLAESLEQMKAGMVEKSPSLVIFDFSFSESQTLPWIQRIKREYPQTRFILLIDRVQQNSSDLAREVDAILLIGFKPAQLLKTIGRLESGECPWLQKTQ